TSSLKKQTRAERLYSGRDVLAIMLPAMAYDLDFDESEDPEVNHAVGAFLQEIRDCGEVGDLMDPMHRVEVSADLTKQIRGLEQQGYAVWGALAPRTMQL